MKVKWDLVDHSATFHSFQISRQDEKRADQMVSCEVSAVGVNVLSAHVERWGTLIWASSSAFH